MQSFYYMAPQKVVLVWFSQKSCAGLGSLKKVGGNLLI